MSSLEGIEELSIEEHEALKSMGPIFHYMGEWKPYLIHYRAENGLFFGDLWTIPDSDQYVIYLGDELLFKLTPKKDKENRK